MEYIFFVGRMGQLKLHIDMTMKRNIQFVALICVLLRFSTSAFAGYAKGTIVVKSAPIDKEWGYVSVDGSKYIDATKIEQPAEFTSEWGAGGSTNISFYVSALARTGYYCAGWGTSSENTDVETTSTCKITKKCDVATWWATTTTDFGIYYAIFKPAEITSPANGSTIQGVTLTEPLGKAENAQITLSVKATRAEDFVVQITGNQYIQYNSHSFDNGNLVIDYTYSAHNVDGTDKATITVTSAGRENAYTFTLVCKTSLIPTFTLSPSSVAFGEISIVGSKTENIAPATSNTTAKNAVWTMWIDGTQKEYFSISGTGADGYAHPANGQASIIFSPSAESSYSAKLKTYCVYTDGEGNSLQSATASVDLSGRGVAPKEALLTLSNTSANAGVYDETTSSYTYLDQYGTVTHSADFIIGLANVDNLQYDFGGTNTSGIFAFTPQNEESGKVRLTITAKSQQTLTEATTYTATLTISAKSIVAADNSKTLTQTLKVSVTIYPKKKNTLAWGLPLYTDKAFYVLYTDDKDVFALKDINNTDFANSPITISCSTSGYDQYFKIDNTTHTLSPLKVRDANMSIKAVQPESDEYEGVTITGLLRVRKHDFAWVYTGGSGLYLYKNTYYPHFISSTAEQAGEATLKVSYYDDGVRTSAPVVKDGSFRQTLKQNADGSWAIQTGDTITPRKYRNTQGNDAWQYLRLYIQQDATSNYYGTTQSPNFQIIKDPIHVPVSPNYSVNTTTGVKSGLWGNNHYQQNGSTFLVDKYNAEWIGYDWNWNTNTWTGTNTGRTDWTTVAKQGSTNAFALQNGGYVVFHFRGVPQYTGFNMWFQTATSDGTVGIEESIDGNTWTTIALSASAKADYLTTAGWKQGWMKDNSRYIRFSYKGNNHVVLSVNLYENNFVRTDFASFSTKKVLEDTLTNHELHNMDNGGWGTFDFAINAANWGKTGVEVECSNPHFSVVLDNPFDVTKGLDNYEEHTAHVKYNGTALYDETIVRLKLHNFYGSTATDTLRFYSFKVRAIGTGAAMPQTITNITKSTKYATGTVGPIRNYKIDASHPYGDLQTTDYSYSQGNISPNSGLREHTFEHCFGNDGKPLFDVLYIFGMTHNSDGAVETYTSYYENAAGDTLKVSGTYPKISESDANNGSNAVTPLYIYDRSGEQYVLSQTIPNTNISDALIKIGAKGQKIYFSGHCPALSTGYKKDENGGAIFVSGGKGATIDLYFEDCVVRSRTHSQNGNSVPVDKDDNYGSMAAYPKSTGSTLVFQCTASQNSDTPFKPSVHFMGENRLRSTTGKPLYFGVELFGLGKNITRSCSPVEVLVSSDKSYTNITFDDVWLSDLTGKEYRTNGYFRFTKGGGSNCPSVDLGNANTILNFAGGRIELQNSKAGSDKYTNTLAISYRKYNSSYGVGSDQEGGTVYFLDGTVFASPLEISKATERPWYIYSETNSMGETFSYGIDTIRIMDGKGGTTYKYFTTTLRSPKNTYIQGGSHNVPIRVCALSGSYKDSEGVATMPGGTPTDGEPNPQKVGRLDVEIPVSDIDEKGFAKFDFPEDMGNPTTKQTLAEYYKQKGWYYGLNSMAPDKEGYIHLWLPLDWLGRIEKETQKTQNWVECMTPIDVKVPTSNGGLLEKRTIGGEKKVDTQKNNLNLMYCVIDQTMRDLMAEKNFKMPVKNPFNSQYEQRGIEKIGQVLQSEITNTDDYTFTSKLYYITTVEADIWKSFTPPFDVKKMYVVNTYPDSIYSESVENGQMTRAAALKEQAQQNANFAGFIGVGIIMDWYGGTLESYTQEFLNWAYGQDTTPINNKPAIYPKTANQKMVNGVKEDYYPHNYSSAKGYTKDYRGMQRITNFKGNNYDANFYLYHSKNKTWTYDGKKFATDWELVIPQADSILLHTGEIYAMQFPYCPGCDDLENRDYWDYWTGKLIIMEGTGPQTIKGSNAQAEQFTAYDVDNSASLRGNATFAKMQVPNYSGATGYLNNVFFHTSGTSKFTPSTDQETGLIEPTNVFLLANPGTRLQIAPRKVASIAVETGVITYEDESNSTTAVPTVSGGRTLIVNSVDGGLTVIPVVPQQVGIYGSAGQLIASDYMTDETTLSLPAGIYMVCGEKETAKVIVR